MTEGVTAPEWEPLLVEQFADWLGFTWLAERLPGDIYPPYLYLATFLFLDFGLSNTYKQVFTDRIHGFLRNPYSVVIPLGLLLAALGIRYMRQGHETAVKDLRFEERADDTDHHKQVFSFRTKFATYLVLLIGMVVNSFLIVGLGEFIDTQGFVHALLVNVLIVPIGYLPFAVEGVLMYISVHVLLPRRLQNADLGVFFFDPRNMGGFEPVGNLLKYTYYLYTAGLLLYLVFLYGPVVGPLDVDQVQTPGVLTAAMFTVLWLIGIATLAYSMFKVHRIMAAEKEERLREIEDQLREVVGDPYEITTTEFPDDGEFEDIQRRLREIRATSEYPTTFTMWVQIGISVLLPQILQLLIRASM